MAKPISLEQFLRERSDFTPIDVRKQSAFLGSGLLMPGARRQLPFDAENWWPAYKGDRLAIFCVHGHEVSKAVAGFLADQGLDAAYLEGGFEAYRAAGQPTLRAVEQE
jgi:thiosulfate sulfurtransferase